MIFTTAPDVTPWQQFQNGKCRYDSDFEAYRYNEAVRTFSNPLQIMLLL